MSNTRPDYKLHAMLRSAPGEEPRNKGRVGSAWNGPHGRISIKLSPFVVLSAADDLVLSLFPNDDP